MIEAVRWVLDTCKEKDALWKHGGNPMQPHALLSSGLHSDGFFNWKAISQYPLIAQDFADELAKLLYQKMGHGAAHSVNRMVGPGTGAITLADRVAGSTVFGSFCKGGFTEKVAVEGRAKPIQKLNGFTVDSEYIVTCEDTVTTGDSVLETITAVIDAGGIVLPYVAAICNRSGQRVIRDRTVVSLIFTHMQNWTPQECPLCKAGSQAIPPKKDNNWQRLNATYN